MIDGTEVRGWWGTDKEIMGTERLGQEGDSGRGGGKPDGGMIRGRDGGGEEVHSEVGLSSGAPPLLPAGQFSPAPRRGAAGVERPQAPHLLQGPPESS